MSWHIWRFPSRPPAVSIWPSSFCSKVNKMAQLEYELAHLTPSLLAASSLYLALILLQQGKQNGPAGV
jgi:hypothetical protein